MLFADSPEACPYGFHRFVIFDQTDKLQFHNRKKKDPTKTGRGG